MRILADTSIWVEHLRHGEGRMSRYLSAGDIVLHDHVVGELCLGGLSRDKLKTMRWMRRCKVASHDEVMHLIDKRKLAGCGLGYADTHLLAAALIGHLQLWTRDKALQQAAQEYGCGVVAH